MYFSWSALMKIQKSQSEKKKKNKKNKHSVWNGPNILELLKITTRDVGVSSSTTWFYSDSEGKKNDQSDEFCRAGRSLNEGSAIRIPAPTLMCGSALGQGTNPSSSVWECLCIVKELQSSTVAQSMFHLIFICCYSSPKITSVVWRRRISNLL